MKMKLINKKIFTAALFLLVFVSSSTLAETGAEASSLESVVKIMVAVTAFLIAIIMWLILVFSEKSEATQESNLKKILHVINKRPAVDDEQKLLLDHDYDGIKELNNKIPPWFMAIFYGSIIWAAIYMVDFHIIGSGNVQEEEYLAEVQTAELEKEILNRSGALVNEETVTLVDDAASLSSGKDIFVKSCAACHGMKGEGLVGPNFTDDYWIHGNTINDLFKVVKYGVPQKGMISWQTQLNPTQMQEVSSYILTLRGTDPPNQKAPEGELYEYQE
jgi:cytochrome c oxidase cbb3-type subunit 3